MASSGSVVTSAGLVFAATMTSFIVSDLRILGQVGTTIGLGLLFDTLIVRSFMTPSVAALLGRWFWWPQRVRRAQPAPCFGHTGHVPQFANCCCGTTKMTPPRRRLLPGSRHPDFHDRVTLR
jgi:RND superfamily putative drug exporter